MKQKYDLLEVEVTTLEDTLEGYIWPQSYLLTYINELDDVKLFKAIKSAGFLELTDYDESILLIDADYIISLRVLAYEER